MAKQRSKLLIGCGIGCGIAILFGVLLLVGGALFISDTTEGFESAIDLRETLEQQHGPATDFIPWPDGAVPAARAEAFLLARELSDVQRDQVAERFKAIVLTAESAEQLEQQGPLEMIGSVFGITRKALGIGAEMGNFFEARNHALLEAGVGMGEYSYLYVIAYHGLLGHPPGDGPQNASIQTSAASSVQGGGIDRRVRDELRTMLRNQLAAQSENEATDPAWREALAEEVALLEADSGRLPWQDGLPATLAASLEPYRDRLDATYEPMTHPFELLRNKRQGRFSIRAE